MKRCFSVSVMKLVRPSRNREDVAAPDLEVRKLSTGQMYKTKERPDRGQKPRMKATAAMSVAGASTAVLYRMPSGSDLTSRGDDASAGEIPVCANGQLYIAPRPRGGSE